MKLKLKRKHSAGMLKIKDRKPKLDGEKNPLKDKAGNVQYIKLEHRLAPGAFGKAFDVCDVEYVLNRHGAILEKA